MQIDCCAISCLCTCTSVGERKREGEKASAVSRSLDTARASLLPALPVVRVASGLQPGGLAAALLRRAGVAETTAQRSPRALGSGLLSEALSESPQTPLQRCSPWGRCGQRGPAARISCDRWGESRSVPAAPPHPSRLLAWAPSPPPFPLFSSFPPLSSSSSLCVELVIVL